MNIYVEFIKSTSQSALAQVLKSTLIGSKDLTFYCLVDKNNNTSLLEDKNLKLVRSKDEVPSIDIELNFDNETVSKDFISFNLLKTNDNKKIILLDKNNDSLSLIEKFNKVESLFNKNNENFKFGLLTFPRINESLFDEFDNNFKDNPNYLGKLSPREIYSKDINLLITTPLITNIYIETLESTTDFFEQKKKKDEEKKSSMSKMFSKMMSFQQLPPTTLKFNNLIDLTDYYINDNKLICILEKDANYEYYYSKLSYLISLLQK